MDPASALDLRHRCFRSGNLRREKRRIEADRRHFGADRLTGFGGDAVEEQPAQIAAVKTFSSMEYGLRTFFPLRLYDYATPVAVVLHASPSHIWARSRRFCSVTSSLAATGRSSGILTPRRESTQRQRMTVARPVRMTAVGAFLACNRFSTTSISASSPTRWESKPPLIARCASSCARAKKLAALAFAPRG